MACLQRANQKNMSPHKLPIPGVVRRILTLNQSAWLVGGAARWVAAGSSENTPRDWDIVITDPGEWNRFASEVKAAGYEFKLNTFGGFKLQINDLELDVWCDTMQNVLARPFNTHLYHMATNSIWYRG